VDATFTEVVENELLVGEEGGMIVRLEFHREGEKQPGRGPGRRPGHTSRLGRHAVASAYT
jgi:hypothetical protein